MFAQDFCHPAGMSSQAQDYAKRVLMAFEIAGLYTDEEIKAAGGPSSSTMTKFRRVAEGDDMPEPRGDTHRRIDTALGWPMGSSRELWHRQRELVGLLAAGECE